MQVNVDKHKLARAPQMPGGLSDKTPKSDFLSNVYGYFGQRATWQEPASSAAAAFNSARKASQLKGMTVQNDTRKDIGTVENVILNVPAGCEVYLIISPSSDMSLGNNLYALPPGAVKLSSDQKMLVANVTREKLAKAPHFAKDDWSELSNNAWAQKVYQYYGQSANFGGMLKPTGRFDQNTQTYPKQ